MAGYMGSEAYDFSLFEPQIIESPKRNTQSVPKKSVKRANENVAQPKKKSVAAAKGMQQTVARDSLSVAVSNAVKKALAFGVFCCLCLVATLVMESQCNELDKQISAVQSNIEIAESEAVRLNAQLSSKISSDEIEDYVENVLGMVKAESYQISYIDLSEGDEIVVSGDKTVGGDSDFSGKIKELFAYIF